MKKINLLMSMIVVVSALSIACGDAGSGSLTETDSGKETSSQEKEMEEEEKTEDTLDQADKEKEFKQQCQSVDYREYFRNDQKYIGEKIKVELLVDQVIEGDCRGYDMSDNEYYISDLRTGEDKFRIMEGDWITVYGEFAGVQQITRALGEYESDIFCIDGRYIDLYEEENQDSLGTMAYGGDSTAVGTEEEDFRAQEQGEYIFPDSDVRLLTEEEINSLSQDELRIAVNEIYARHGRKFADAKLQEYFNTKSWYQGTIEPDQFNEMVFNEFEKENVKKLSDRKNEKYSGRLAVEQIYGIYECHTEYLDAELEVGVYTGDNTDYIRLVGSSSDGRGSGEFDGIVVSVKENNYTAVDELGNVIDVYFDGAGNAKVTDGNTGLGGMYFPGFEGTYQMIADFSHAG